MPASPVRSFNGPPWTSYAVDYDEAFRDPRTTNLAAPLTGPQTITVTDVVPAGMTFTNVTSVNWTCSPIPGPPIPAGGTLTCTYARLFTGECDDRHRSGSDHRDNEHAELRVAAAQAPAAEMRGAADTESFHHRLYLS